MSLGKPIIDFDSASDRWRQNKIHKENGSFVYRCTYVHSNGETCRKPSVSPFVHACKQHQVRLQCLQMDNK